jgi:hypothetical protein
MNETNGLSPFKSPKTEIRRAKKISYLVRQVREELPGLTDADEKLYVRPWARLMVMSLLAEQWIDDGEHQYLDGYLRTFEVARRCADRIGLGRANEKSVMDLAALYAQAGAEDARENSDEQIGGFMLPPIFLGLGRGVVGKASSGFFEASTQADEILC